MAKTTAKATKSKATKAKTSQRTTTGKETNLVKRVTSKSANTKIAGFGPGDTVNVYVKVIEGEKERVQLYKGVVTKIQGHAHRTFTVRKISAGVGVERTFPFNSPAIDSVEVVAHGKVRRAKLYYLRGLDGKAARIESELAATSSSAAE
ncbi:MAG: ribosomal protein [Pseudobdellovibrio sp.]|jgi:large subunit ribosomal protein L19|nr:ribosomal protein [Pseudobdellovibrio sp.]